MVLFGCSCSYMLSRPTTSHYFISVWHIWLTCSLVLWAKIILVSSAVWYAPPQYWSQPSWSNKTTKNGYVYVDNTLIPGNMCSPDKTMQETFIHVRFNKSRYWELIFGVVIHVHVHEPKIQTTSERDQLYKAALEMWGLADVTELMNT